MNAATRSYWGASRAPRYSLIFALPLLVAYEALAALFSHTASGDVRNGADVLLKLLFFVVAGRYGPALFMVVVIALSVWLIGRDMRARGRRLEPSVFAAMLGESVFYGLAFGLVVGTLTARLLGTFGAMALAQGEPLGTGAQIMVSLGAGLYEELLFRVVLVSALAGIARAAFGWRPLAAGLFAALLGAFIFSAFHYIGPYGDPLRLDSFVFRWIGGLAFSGLYLLRGFGITAWTHALYDLFLLAA